MDFERIISVRGDGLGTFEPITRGISMEDYNSLNSDDGDTEDPVRKWDIIDAGSGDQFEVWPMPASNGETIRFDGFKALGAFTSESDTCTLDDTLIVMFAAAHILTGQDDKLAKTTLSQANQLYNRMRGGASRTEGQSFVMGSEVSRAVRSSIHDHPMVIAPTEA
jgi:hypothetical protein